MLLMTRQYPQPAENPQSVGSLLRRWAMIVETVREKFNMRRLSPDNPKRDLNDLMKM
jgi:hypothetical protein